jgi:hypothetical protein
MHERSLFVMRFVSSSRGAGAPFERRGAILSPQGAQNEKHRRRATMCYEERYYSEWAERAARRREETKRKEEEARKPEVAKPAPEHRPATTPEREPVVETS